MSRLFFAATALVAVFVLGACVSISPTGPGAPTVPAVPTAIPTQALPGATGNPVATPAQPSSGNLCDKVTLDEVSAAAGGLPAVLGEDYDLEGECNWDVGEPNELGTPDAFVNLRRDFGNALDDARTLFPNGQDVAVGEEGYWVPELYTLTFRQNGSVYTAQIVVVDADAIDPLAVATGIATAATPRL